MRTGEPQPWLPKRTCWGGRAMLCSTSTLLTFTLPHHLPMEHETEEQTLHRNSSVPSPLNYLTSYSVPLERSPSNPCRAPQHIPAQGGLTRSPWAASQFHPVTARSWGRQEQPVETACSVSHPSTFLYSCPGPKVGSEPWLGKKRM